MEFQTETTKISLATELKPVNPNKLYMVDFSKLNSVNDLVLILSAMSIAFPGDHPAIEQLKPFLNLDNGFDIPGRELQPEAKEISLPKLKSIK